MKTIARMLCASLALLIVTGRSALAAAGSPQVSAVELWKDLQGYQKWWVLWPKTEPMHPGTPPHGPFITVYVNLRAVRSVNWKEKAMLSRATILVENYDADRALTGYSLMRKVEGFNPEAGDWYWAQYGPKGEVRAEGKVEDCIQCHRAQADNDYVFTAVLKEAK